MKDVEQRAYAAVIGAVMLWGTIPATVTVLMADIHKYLIVMYTGLFAVVGLGTVVVASGRARRLLAYNKHDLGVFALMGLLGSFGYAVLLYNALERGPVIEAALAGYLWPIMTVLWSAALALRPPSLRSMAGLLTSLCGVAVISTGGDLATISFDRMGGVLLAIAASTSYGLFSALGARRDDDRTTALLLCFAFHLLYATVLVVTFVPGGIVLPAGRVLAGIAYLGLVTYGLGYVLWFYALAHGDTATVSNLGFLTPFVSLAAIRSVLGEVVHPSALAGLVVIVVGIFITRSGRVQKTPSPSLKPGPSTT